VFVRVCVCVGGEECRREKKGWRGREGDEGHGRRGVDGSRIVGTWKRKIRERQKVIEG
jgi:hypothetical protein